MAGVVAWGAPSSASPLALSWTNPRYNAAAAESCWADSPDTLRDLYQIRFDVVRFKVPLDTLRLYVDAQGKEGQAQHVDLDLPAGTMGTVTAWALDTHLNAACMGPSYLYALPALDFTPGLRASYFDNPDLTAVSLVRTDAQVNFDWDLNAPAPGMNADQFSIVWEGKICPAITGLYVFTTRTEDGDSLRIGGDLLVNDWAVQNEHDRSGQKTLTAGVEYAFRLTHLSWNGTAMIRLDWTPPGGTRVTVPAEAFRQ